MADLDTLISGRNYTLPIPLNTGVAASRVFRDPICWRDPIRRHPIGCPGLPWRAHPFSVPRCRDADGVSAFISAQVDAK